MSELKTAAAVDCRLRRSARAKRLRLVVRPGLIELVVPSGVREATALAFLAEHRSWAEGKALEFERKSQASPKPAAFCDLPAIVWQGRELPLRISESPRSRIRVQIDHEVRIDLPAGLNEAKDQMAKRALYLWVRRWLSTEVSRLVDGAVGPAGLLPREIRVKAMKTRWGSCGPRNDININWLLAFVPAEVLRYVVIHELCHIRERNHSAAFWSLVARHCPDYPRHRHWLRSHGPALMQQFAL